MSGHARLAMRLMAAEWHGAVVAGCVRFCPHNRHLGSPNEPDCGRVIHHVRIHHIVDAWAADMGREKVCGCRFVRIGSHSGVPAECGVAQEVLEPVIV